MTRWDRVMEALSNHLAEHDPPFVTMEAETHRSPFRVLVATLISLRTKDETTAAASARLFALADTPEAMANLDDDIIAAAVRPANFYPTKARRIRAISRRLVEEFGGRVPSDLDTLLSFDGVGRKTANLVLTEGFDLPGVCVDTHVHRISNRMGMVRTKNPNETEFALRKSLPQKYWKPINTLMVSFGQKVCRPQSPHCSICPMSDLCKRVGVARSR
ncbi:MAG: endonuclease III [Deltaproteobacteria bacterium]|nr:endonuclease III [Deltaproteobacteria bacterium]